MSSLPVLRKIGIVAEDWLVVYDCALTSCARTGRALIGVFVCVFACACLSISVRVFMCVCVYVYTKYK